MMPVRPLGSISTQEYVIELWAEFVGPQNVIGGTIRLNERSTGTVSLQEVAAELKNSEKFLRLKKAAALLRSELGPQQQGSEA